LYKRFSREDISAQLKQAFDKFRESLAGGLQPPKTCDATSPADKTQESSGSQKRQQQQAAGSASEDQGIAAAGSGDRGGLQATAGGPSSSDPILPHPADAANLHSHETVLVQPLFACPPGLESSFSQGEKPTERRSQAPSRRSPGPQSKDAKNQCQMEQVMAMMHEMTRELQDMKSKVVTMQQHPLRPLIPYDTTPMAGTLVWEQGVEQD
jgi:hypothetical protein